MQENKKIKGSKKVEYGGIKFKSVSEKRGYEVLQDSGLDFTYEEDTFVLWEGIKIFQTRVIAPKKIPYKRGRYTKELYELGGNKLRNITYTPDYTVRWKTYIIYIDIKGMENDVYPLKKKMFLKLLEDMNVEAKGKVKFLFAEPHSIPQLRKVIEIIKSL